METNVHSQNGNGKHPVSEPGQQTDEQLIQLLNDLYAANQAVASSPDPKEIPKAAKEQLELARNNLVSWCEAHLRHSMRAIMVRLFGSQVTKDGSLRFTVLWNDVLVKVLKSGKLKAPEGDVIKSLTSYFSSALANQARDYLRRRKSHSKILDDHIKPLVEQRECYLKENYGIHIELLLEMAEKWENAGNCLGTALRLRYIDGMTYEQIGEALALSRDSVKRVLADGRKRLKDIANKSEL
jgi:RNA polymerase sigma factor (sigma-70 family)